MVWFLYDHSSLTVLIVYIPSKISFPKDYFWDAYTVIDIAILVAPYFSQAMLIIRVLAMVSTHLDGQYHELVGAHTWDQSDLGSCSSSGNY